MTVTVDDLSEQDTVATRGVVCLAAANFQAFFDTIDTVAAQRGVERVALRNALACLVDDDVTTALDHDVPPSVLLEARDRCRRVAQRDYKEFF